MSTAPAARNLTLIDRPIVWVLAWLIAFVGARLALEATSLDNGVRIAASLLPTPMAALALFSIVRGARQLDELQQRIQLEALAVAFILAVLLLMTLGLLELAIALNRDDWSYRHVWAMLPLLYLLGLAAARKRYA